MRLSHPGLAAPEFYACSPTTVSTPMSPRWSGRCRHHVRAAATIRIEDRRGAAALAQIREVLGLILDVPG